jgi:hypothetical protein
MDSLAARKCQIQAFPRAFRLCHASGSMEKSLDARFQEK